jgi:hypothetical protein
MLSNNEIQADIVTKLKASALLTALVNANEVREDQWKGNSFGYPNVRVSLGQQTPVNNLSCPIVKMPFDVVCFSENASSKEADQIAYAVMKSLDKIHFTGTYVRFIYLHSVTMEAAIAEDERTWKSTVKFESLVQKK